MMNPNDAHTCPACAEHADTGSTTQDHAHGCVYAPTCLQDGPDCQGAVEYRMPLSGTGKPFARCDHHWNLRLIEQDRINRTYPTHAPADFDPSYAGERWDDDY
jgi:hypothetical protein